MKRILFLTLLTLALALLLTGCASSADTMPSQSPGVNGTASPLIPSNIPQATDDGMLGDLGDRVDDLLNGRDGVLMNAEDALKASRSLRDAVQKLTEVDTADAVVTGSTALVGVTYDASYRGGIDDRLRAMVLDRAQAVTPAITAVAVTDDAAAIKEIASLYDLLQGGTAYSTVQADAEKLAESLERYQK